MAKLKTFKGLQATTRNEVANDVWKAFKNGKNYVKSGTKLRGTFWLFKVLPKSIIFRMMRDELSEVK